MHCWFLHGDGCSPPKASIPAGRPAGAAGGLAPPLRPLPNYAAHKIQPEEEVRRPSSQVLPLVFQHRRGGGFGAPPPPPDAPMLSQGAAGRRRASRHGPSAVRLAQRRSVAARRPAGAAGLAWSCSVDSPPEAVHGTCLDSRIHPRLSILPGLRKQSVVSACRFHQRHPSRRESILNSPSSVNYPA